MSRKPSVTGILILVGSLRAASVNRQLAQLVIDTAPATIRVELFGRLGELPHYNEDIDGEPPLEPVGALRNAARCADALLMVTPEYNGSIPGVLKNAIDWLSRPYGHSPMNGKPAAVVGVSLGQYGGRWAHDDTVKSLGIAGLRPLDDVNLSIPTKTLRERHPREHPRIVDGLRAIVGRLAHEVQMSEG